jgi:hypothetical protein
MSEYKIVNRVSTPQLDAAMAEAGINPGQLPVQPQHLIKNWQQYPNYREGDMLPIDGTVQTAEGQRAPYVGKIEEHFPEPPPAQSLEESEEDKLAAIVAGQLGSAFPTDIGFVRKRDFEDFVVKVLAAFKHMGLDMRKHFP